MSVTKAYNEYVLMKNVRFPITLTYIICNITCSIISIVSTTQETYTRVPSLSAGGVSHQN